MMMHFSRGELLDELAHVVLLVRVQAVGRLVEEQHGRVVHERLGEPHAAAVALGERADGLVHHVADGAHSATRSSASRRSLPRRPRASQTKRRNEDAVISS